MFKPWDTKGNWLCYLDYCLIQKDRVKGKERERREGEGIEGEGSLYSLGMLDWLKREKGGMES